MNASQNEVSLIMDAINDVRRDVAEVRTEVRGIRTDMGKMDSRINGRIRSLERFRWQLMGAFVFATFVVGIAVRFM